MVVTDREDLADQLRLLHNLGQHDRYYHELPGANSRLDEMQAAILRVKLRHLDDYNEARQSAAVAYFRHLAGSDVALPEEMPYGRHVYHLFVIQTPYRDEMRAYLSANGVETLIHYPIPIHLQKAYQHLGFQPGAFPVAERQAQQIISLPMYAEITEEEIAAVSRCILEFPSKR